MRLFKSEELEAYMTVEASFIVPITTMIIALIIYLSFFQYGKCLLSQDVYILGFRAATYGKSQGYDNPVNYVADKSDGQIEEKYFASRDLHIEAHMSGKKVVTEGSLSTRHEALGNSFGDISELFYTEARGTSLIKNTPKLMRRGKRITDLAKNIIN